MKYLKFQPIKLQEFQPIKMLDTKFTTNQNRRLCFSRSNRCVSFIWKALQKKHRKVDIFSRINFFLGCLLSRPRSNYISSSLTRNFRSMLYLWPWWMVVTNVERSLPVRIICLVTRDQPTTRARRMPAPYAGRSLVDQTTGRDTRQPMERDRSIFVTFVDIPSPGKTITSSIWPTTTRELQSN